ncbi:MAG TPA: flagellar basal body P-ring protein FlgI [Bacteroidota bacterium]|nr:flagellar basal body P-ring protein FlgI [Bacteroidota bacterium]
MRRLRWRELAIVAMLGSTAASGATRIKDVASVQPVRTMQVIGYGLVVGLNGTGDTQRSTFTLQSVSSMLKRFGITVPQTDLRLRNAAAVMVTASVEGSAKEGTSCDVVVSSMGDATSLQGGTLLLTPLSVADGTVYAMAQGPLSVGGSSIRENGNEIRRNHTAAGRIPSGALIEKSVSAGLKPDSTISVVLFQADYTTASRIAEAINGKFGNGAALALDGSSVRVNVPQQAQAEGKLVDFISSVELLEITPDVIARVIVNERTGTVVIGGNVSILPVAISHGGLNIEIESVPIVSQPNAFSQGQTVTTQLTRVSAGEDSTSVVAINGVSTVQDVAKALNSLKVSPRDIIAIFQALKEAGALKAELVII